MPVASVEESSDDDVAEASDSANPETQPAGGSLRDFGVEEPVSNLSNEQGLSTEQKEFIDRLSQLDEILAAFKLTVEQKKLLDELFDISMKLEEVNAQLCAALATGQNTIEIAEYNADRDKKETLFQSKRSVFSQHYFSSIADLHEHTHNNLSDLEQKNQTIKDCIESAERAVENISDFKERWTSYFKLRRSKFDVNLLNTLLYEEHCRRLKKDLNFNAAVAESSDDDASSDSEVAQAHPAGGSLRDFVEELAKQSAELALI